MAGYSETPLIRKLGIKEGFSMLIINEPLNYPELLGTIPKASKRVKQDAKDIDFIHFFVKQSKELIKLLPELMKQLKQDGMIWVSWYKKSSGIETDITENLIRDFALKLGLVDVKVCAVDETWSGLKLVIRKQNRKS